MLGHTSALLLFVLTHNFSVSCMIASTFSSDTEPSEPFNGKGSRVFRDKYYHGKDVLADQVPKGVGECVTNLFADECGPNATRMHNVVTSDEISKEGNGGDQLLSRIEKTSEDYNQGASLTEEPKGSRSIPDKKEVCCHISLIMQFNVIKICCGCSVYTL